MKELREIYDFGELQIITEKSKLPKYALAKLSYSFARSDSENSNKRTYPESILSREINRKSEELRKGKIAGQLEHPLSGITKLDKVAHVLNSVWYDRNTKLAAAESFILDTSKGRDFMVLLEAELKMGVSMRGFGNVINGKIQSDYKFDTVDFVLHPSFGSDAMIDQSNIIESANSIFDEEENEVGKELESAINDLEKESFLSACNSGFKGTQKEWDMQYSGSLREMMGLPKAKGKTSVRLTEQQIKDRTHGYFLEAQAGGFMGSFDEWKQKFPQIVETASKEVKLNEKKAPEPKVPFKSKATWEEIKLSGFRGTMAEYEEKYPDITIIKPEPPQKPIVETLEDEAQRIYEGLKKDNPNSSLTLESVRNMLEKEYESKREKKTRELAIYRVNRSMAGSGSIPSSAILEKMIVREIESIKEEREEKKRKNWAAYKKLLSD